MNSVDDSMREAVLREVRAVWHELRHRRADALGRSSTAERDGQHLEAAKQFGVARGCQHAMQLLDGLQDDLRDRVMR